MPPFTFMHPVLHGASERWKNGGGVNGLLGILRSPRIPAVGSGETDTQLDTFIAKGDEALIHPTATNQRTATTIGNHL
eukprot:200513-Pleurochrysis_carterae.AAC.5